MPAFIQDEYYSRMVRLRKKMADLGIDAMLVLEESSLNYITGYEGYSDYVPQVALICQDDEYPWLIMRELDSYCAMTDSYLPESRILSYAEKYIGSNELTAWQPIGELVRERTKSSRIGVEISGKMLGVKGHAALSKSLGMSEFIDADGLVSTLKAIKSPAELTYMQQAGKIVDRAMKVAQLQIAVGARECDIAAAVQHSLTSGTPEFPGHPSYVGLPLMAVGSPPNQCHSKWGNGVYKMGCQTNFEMAAFRHRYACALSRTVFLGEPPARARHVHQACHDGFLAALDALRPGVKSSDVERAFRREFAPRGVRKESRIGYSIGIDWVDGGPSFQERDETVIQANMTFHLLIGIWEKTDGYVFSETVRVTDNGAMSLSNMSRDLLVNY
ncbi:MAG: M24 family metallopeptidase [Mesorhizobium sp.]|uniref:M24 family metallopeptidase n=1 Tax=Mesorhizobium sp. TaxID=1871066 RepID=UPI00120B8C68|nr:Xaa-Pro peptidase family protein [Mesorhizobium sp.]TIP22998.1 MAG: M24 family metallopeptidase [Mesorhizobium sp.]